ncbi:MAG: hypothetical protein RLZZ293_227 [Pseudomonadota bacterium]|jgi:hypothetical protein
MKKYLLEILFKNATKQISKTSSLSEPVNKVCIEQ